MPRFCLSATEPNITLRFGTNVVAVTGPIRFLGDSTKD